MSTVAELEAWSGVLNWPLPLFHYEWVDHRSTLKILWTGVLELQSNIFYQSQKFVI